MLGTAVESADHPVITIRATDGTIAAWNQAAERIYQYTAAEAIGNDIEIIVPPDRTNEHILIFASLLTGEPIEEFETIRLTKDGQKVGVALSARPVISPSGEIVGVTTITRKLTAEKIASNNMLLAGESCPSGMVMVDGAGTIVLVNAETERLFQYRREELIGRSIEILVPPRYCAELVRFGKALYDDPHAQPMGIGGELFALRKDGTEIAVNIGLNPIRTQDGSIVILGAINEVTGRVHDDHIKDEFVAMVSHELRTPLTSIAASLGLLVADPAGTLSDPAKRLLSIAYSNSQRLVRLVNDILDIEKIESGKVELQMNCYNVLTLLEQVIESNRGFADQYEVTVRLDPGAIDADICTDADRFMQVVTNLLSNAIKYSPPRGEVMVTTEIIGPSVRIGVRDRGPGIPEEFRARIFERFAQADSSDARLRGGTGLGLNIVRELVFRLGGQTGFDPASGGGTIFHVDLPRFALSNAVGATDFDNKEVA